MSKYHIVGNHVSLLIYIETRRTNVWFIIYVISVLILLCFRVRLLIDALLSPVGKGLTYRLSFVVSGCEVVAFPLVSWVRCGD